MKNVKNIKPNQLLAGCLCAFAAEILYGLSYVFTKDATEDASALSLLGWRFFIAFVVMSLLAATGMIKINLKGKSIKPLLAVAIFNPVLYLIGETIGISQTTASESGVFLACIPVASLAASTLILHEEPTKPQVIGILITLAGVLITILAVGTSSSLSIAGYLCLFLGVICSALYSVYVEKASDFSGTEITYMMLVCGMVVFTLLAFIQGVLKGELNAILSLPFHDTRFLTAILYQGIGCSVIAFFLSNVAISKIGVNRTSSFIGIATVVSAAAGAVILKEAFTMYQSIGAAIIIAGVYIANMEKQAGGLKNESVQES